MFMYNVPIPHKFQVYISEENESMMKNLLLNHAISIVCVMFVAFSMNSYFEADINILILRIIPDPEDLKLFE